MAEPIGEEMVQEPVVEAPQEEIVETPAEQEVPLPPPVPEKKFHTYQPVDEQGRPMGGKQVLEYTTEEELVAKLQEQNVLLLRRLRAETRKNRLGIQDAEEIAAEAPRYTEPVDFKPSITPDQKVKLARELNIDPERFDETTEALFESAIGVKPEVLRQTLTRLQEDNAAALAGREADIFVASNPGYYKCAENLEAITGWMIRKGLAPVRENFQLAYNTLKAANVLVEAPTVVEPVASALPPVQPAPVAEPADEPAVPAQAVPATPRIPTGLTRGQATDGATVRPAGEDIVYEFQQRDSLGNPVGPKKVFKGIAALNMMPADEYKRRINTEPGFAKKAEKVEAEAAARRRQ